MRVRRYPTIDIFIAQRLLLVGTDQCWIYPGRRDKDGYSGYKCKGSGDYKAHRAAYRVIHGCPDGLYILHSCDNPPCANPFHLSKGTAKDNYADAKARDRHTRGERNAASKLTADQVLAIRADHRTQVVIAAEYGILQTTVSEIKLGHRWKHLL